MPLAADKPVTEMTLRELALHFSAMSPDQLHEFYASGEFSLDMYYSHPQIVMTLLSHALVRLQIASDRNTKP